MAIRSLKLAYSVSLYYVAQEIKFFCRTNAFKKTIINEQNMRYFWETVGTFSIRFFVGNGKPQTAKCHVTKALRSRLQFAVHV